MTTAQRDMLQKAVEAGDWHTRHCALYSVARALFVRGQIEMMRMRGGKIGVKITDAGREALDCYYATECRNQTGIGSM